MRQERITPIFFKTFGTPILFFSPTKSFGWVDLLCFTMAKPLVQHKQQLIFLQAHIRAKATSHTLDFLTNSHPSPKETSTH